MMNKTLVAVVISAAFSGSAFANCNNGASFNQNYRDCVNTKFEQVQGALDGMLTSVTYNSVENEKQDKEINGVKHRVDALEQGQKDLSTSINKVKGIATDALGAASNAQAQADANKQAITDTQVAVSGNTQAISKIETKLDWANKEIAETNANVNSVKEIATGAAAAAQDAHNRIDGVENAVTNVKDDLKVTNDNLNSVKGTANEALNTANANSAAIKDTNTRVDAVEHVANAAVKDAAKAQTTADRAESKADAAQSTADKAVTAAAGAQSTAELANANAIGAIKGVNAVSGVAHEALNTANANTQAIYAHGNALKQHGETLKAHGDRLENHDKRIGSIEQQMNGFKSDLADLQDEVKAVGAMSMAAANLHYVGVENSYAMSMGQYRSATALAAGAQFNVNEKTAVTVQLATDFTGSLGGAVGVHGRW